MNLEELVVYQLAESISDKIWNEVIVWNFFDKDTIGKQLVKAADSISANVSEGYGRFFYKENRQFCYYARGSLFETKTWINKARKRNLMSEEIASQLLEELEILSIKLNAYIKSIGQSKSND